MSGIKFRPYFIGSSVSFIPWVICLTLLGESFLTLDIWVIMTALLLLICVYAGMYFAVRYASKTKIS